MEVNTVAVPPEADGARLDVFLLRHAPPGTTRGTVQRAIAAGAVRMVGKHVVKPSTPVRAGQDLFLSPGALATPDGPENAQGLKTHGHLPELTILHEDPSLIVLDKPAGVPVHQGIKTELSLADALLARYPALRNVGESADRAGIAHRLDKDTSGVLLVARTPKLFDHLKRQFLTRRVRKEYVALVYGTVSEDSGIVKLPIARSKRNPLRRTIARAGEGKDAETSFTVLERFHEHTLLAVFPRTGRMHQIRVHLAHLGFPVAGDALYSRASRHRTPPGLGRQFLHATAIAVELPSGKTKTFVSPLPPDLSAVLATLRATPTGTPEKPTKYRWRAPRLPRS